MTRRSRRNPFPAARRGLTVIEVVIATATLATAAAMILGGITFSERVAQRGREKLIGAEIAHRIIVTHIRDQRELLGQPERISFAGTLYEFELDEEVLLKETLDGGRTRRTAQKSSDVAFTDKLNNQLFRVTVSVWRNGEKSPSVAPIATLSRVFNPFLGVDSNEDNLMDLLKKELSPELDR